MLDVVISLLPFIIGSAIVPIQIIVLILLLTSEKQGPLKAIAFVVGMTLVRLAQGVVFGYIFTGGDPDSADGAAQAGVIVPTLMLVLGALLLITAYRQWRKHPDADDPPPKWLTATETMSQLKAVAMGAGVVLIAGKMWVFTLGAVGTIGEARLGQASSVVAFLLFVLLAESLVIAPIVLRLVAPAKASVLLEGLSSWLSAHNRVIVIVVSLVFGALFLYKGVTGLV